jgi:hypothetical protein
MFPNGSIARYWMNLLVLIDLTASPNPISRTNPAVKPGEWFQ